MSEPELEAELESGIALGEVEVITDNSDDITEDEEFEP